MGKIIRRKCDWCGREYEYEKGQGSFHKDGSISFERGGMTPKRVCCYECGKQLKRKKVDITCLEKFGTVNPYSSKEIQQKIKNKNLELYGVENPAQNQEIQEKIKETNLNKYGCIAPLQNKEIQCKTVKTNLEKHGVENVFQSNEIKDKIKNTIINNYGVDNPAKAEEIKNKIKATNLKKYGCTCPIGNKEIYYKGIITKKNNNSFKKSKEEDKIYELLLPIFKEVKRQYKSNVYPFACDFYIPSIDVYIEYQGYWTHGWKNNIPFGPFDQTNKEHLNVIEEWKAKFKTNEAYKIAVDVWTIRDPLKRKTAKENNLNWLEFWTIEEVEEWLKSFVEISSPIDSI